MNSLTPSSKNIVPTETPAGLRAFIFMSLGFLLLGTLMLAGRPGFLLNPVLTGHGLAWLKILIFGCALPGVFGVTYWALPRVFEIPLFSNKFVLLHFGFHLVGTLLIIAGLFFDGFRQLSMGPTIIACGAVVFALNIGQALKGFRSPDVAGAFVATTMLWLLITVFLGLPFAEVPPVAIFQNQGWSAAWLLLMLVGVAVNGVLGLTLRVSPHALGIPLIKTDRAWYALAFTNAGLAWLFAALAFGPMSFVIFCAAIYLVGVLIYLMEFFSILQRRLTHLLIWDARILLCALSMLPVAVIFLMLAAWQRMQIPPVDPEAAAAVADAGDVASGVLPLEILPVDGALVLTIVLGVIVPALIALIFQLVRLGSDLPADAESTHFHARLSSQVLLASFFNYAVGVMMIVPGAWAGIDRIVSLGTLFLVVGSGGFLANFIYATGKPSLQITPVDTKELATP